ncbi:hypothetical protein CLU79DRAFT_675980, partial [Phycomyces nitens]
FFITDSEIIPTLVQWLPWIKEDFDLNVKRIIIGCSPTKIAAISQVFEDKVDVILCYLHIKRTWELIIKK